MAEKKSYPLRLSAPVMAALQRWSDDELRSVNAQIEYVLREALVKAGRLKPSSASGSSAAPSAPPTNGDGPG